MRHLHGLACIFMLSACSSVPEALDEANQKPSTAVLTRGQENALIAKQLEPCETLFGLKTAEAEKRSEQAWLLMFGGLVSGAVIAPALTAANAAANAPWISAFSGASGAAVVAVKNADSLGVSGAATLRGLVAVANAVATDLDSAGDVNAQFPVRTAAASRAARKCKMAVFQGITDGA